MEELLDELFSSLEALETKSSATLQFLKDRDHVTDEDLASYVEQAGKASNVRWRAARLRIMSLLASALENVEPADGKAEPADKSAEPVKSEGRATEESMSEAEGKAASVSSTASTSGESSDLPARTERAESPAGQQSGEPPVEKRAMVQTQKANPEAETAQKRRDSDRAAEQRPRKDLKSQKENAA